MQRILEIESLLQKLNKLLFKPLNRADRYATKFSGFSYTGTAS